MLAPQLLEGSIDLMQCVNNPAMCPDAEFCVTQEIWSKVKDVIMNVLESVTLQDLVKREIEIRETVNI